MGPVSAPSVLYWRDIHQLAVNNVGRKILTGSNTILNFIGRLFFIEIVGNRKYVVDHSNYFYNSLHNRTSKLSMSHELRHGDQHRSVSALTRIITPPLDVVRARTDRRKPSRSTRGHIIFLFTNFVNIDSKIKNEEPVFNRLMLVYMPYCRKTNGPQINSRSVIATEYVIGSTSGCSDIYKVNSSSAIIQSNTAIVPLSERYSPTLPFS